MKYLTTLLMLIPNPAISSTDYRLRRYFSTVLSSFRYIRETPEHSNELSARSDSHGCGRKYHPKKFATFRGPRISLRTVAEKYRKSLYSALLIAGFGLILISPGIVIAKDSLVVKRAEKEITLTGYTRKEKSMAISSEVSGRVRRVNYDIGQAIGKKAFIEIDSTFIDFRIESTKQSLIKLDVTLKRMRSRVAYLEKEFLRIDTLHRGDRATGVKRDAAAQELEQARLEFDSIMQERAILETALKESRERKHRHSIYAPKGWVVTERMVEAGEVIQPGIALARASDYRKLVVPLSVSNEEFSAINSLPDVFYAELEGRAVKASINRVNPEFDEKTRKLKIELAIKNFPGERRGGLRFVMPLNIRTEGLLVPKAAVTTRYENPTVTLKKTGEVIHVLVIGESGGYLIVAEDESLAPGTELAPPVSADKAGTR